jgi:hypothetical protein
LVEIFSSDFLRGRGRWGLYFNLTLLAYTEGSKQ